jgi:hypothetical protein
MTYQEAFSLDNFGIFLISDVDEQLRDQVSNFLDSVDLFLELLLSVRALPDGVEEYADDPIIATVRKVHCYAILIFIFSAVETHEFYSAHWTR